ncbi:Double-stranded RNA-binding protein 2 [Euphorbia peplus]|nr:Double-stranded RNA-binding protein 2 [Euphorbia peplus]
MYKNQLQELAQRSCFNLPSYSCIREGPDHAPRFKATVNFNGDTFESPAFCSTLRQAEHAAAEVALNTLACRGPSRALAARVLDETGVYKNLLQETAHRAGLKLPVYTTVRSGPGHVPIFSCTVDLAGMRFTGEGARTKKQAQKNSAMAAWSSLKRLVQHGSPSSSSPSSSFLEHKKGSEEQEQVVIARFLASLQPSEMKNLKQSDIQGGHTRFIPVCRNLTPPTASFYPHQYQNWAYPGFSPEMAIYHMWQQEQLLQLQNRLLTLQVPPSPPQILPYVLPPTSHLFVPVTEQEPLPVSPRITSASKGPLLCLSDNDSSDAIRGKSTVTIQEIHEEKTEELPESSPSMVPDHPIFSNFVAEDNQHKSSSLESKLERIQLEENQTEQFAHASCRNMASGFTDVDFRVQNSHSFVSSKYTPRSSSPCRPPPSVPPPVMIRNVRPISSTASAVRRSSFSRQQNIGVRVPVPPRMRTGIPLVSPRPVPQRMDFGGVQPRFMAPAVRIRSVVPVCSAPPVRNMPSTKQGGASASAAENRKDTSSDNLSTRSSEL